MRLIDADKTIKKAGCLFKDLNSTEEYMGIGYNHGVGDSIAIIKNAPTIEAEPVKHGRWLDDNRRPKSSRFVCSVCGEVAYYPQNHRSDKPRACGYPYCPNCGARMDLEGEEQ